jgi:transposase-like protein
MTNPTKTRRRFTPLQKQEAIELCPQEGLSCNAVAQRWVSLQQPGAMVAPGPRDQGLLSSEERAELNRLRKENRELRRDARLPLGSPGTALRIPSHRTG